MNALSRLRRAALYLIAALAIAGCVLLLAACALSGPSTHGDPVPQSLEVLHLESLLTGNDVDTDALDPAQDFIAPGALQPFVLLYSGLVTLDSQQRPVPYAAARWDVTPDGRVYTFHLRTGLRFAEGTPITAGDVVYSLTRLEQQCPRSGTGFPCSGQPLVQALSSATIDALDPATVTITLAQPDFALPAKLADPSAGIVERSLIERYGADWSHHLADKGGQGTSGMYRLASWQISGARLTMPWTLTLVRNDHFWLHPILNKVVFTFPGASQEQDDYVAGHADVIPSLALEDVAVPRSLPGFRTRLVAEVQAIGLNWRLPPLNDPRVREALALALDRSTLAKLLNAGLAVPTEHLIPQGQPGYDAQLVGPLGITAPAGDPAQARALWLAYVANACGGGASRCAPIEVGGYCQGNPFGFPPESSAAIAMWRAALPGVTVRDETQQGYACILGSYDHPHCDTEGVYAASWAAEYPDPQDWLTNGTAFRCASDVAADALVAQAQTTADPAARTALYQQAEQRMIGDEFVVPIAQAEVAWAEQPWVRDYDPGRWDWVCPAAWAKVYVAAH